MNNPIATTIALSTILASIVIGASIVAASNMKDRYGFEVNGGVVVRYDHVSGEATACQQADGSPTCWVVHPAKPAWLAVSRHAE